MGKGKSNSKSKSTAGSKMNANGIVNVTENADNSIIVGPSNCNSNSDKKPKAQISFQSGKRSDAFEIGTATQSLQLGKDKWDDIALELSNLFDSQTISRRTAKDRIETLLGKFEAEELCNKSGTEEEQTLRGSLLKELQEIIVEANTSIGQTIGPEDTDVIPNADVFSEAEVKEALNINVPKPSTSKLLVLEKKRANEERDQMLNSVAPEASGSRRKRPKMAIEDEMIAKRQEHEMAMEIRKLDLERDKLELEKKREMRIDEENRRRDELASSQIQMQTQMLELLASFAKK